MSPPTSMRALTLYSTAGDFKPGPHLWHPVKVEDVPVPEVNDGQVLVKVLSAGFNHRDVFQRQSLYPGTIFSTPSAPSILGADAVGLVVSPSSHPLYQHRVLLSPHEGWTSSPAGPDQPHGKQWGILGGVKQTGGRGTYAEYIAVGEGDVVECPKHLGRDEAAAVPLGSLTAYRAVFTKAGVKKGDNVLITGIGGGVAILALQFCVAAGANVWVSSSSEAKIKRAVELGAKGGVDYRDPSWPKLLAPLLPSSRPLLDAVIDSGGGPLANQVTRLLRDGAVIACYGQTSGKPIEVGMGFVLKNCELRGSTMGSRDEFFKAVDFIAKHEIHPVVDTVLEGGLDEAEKGFELLKQGGQFGKVVMTIAKDDSAKL